jgi:hypothetical protein
VILFYNLSGCESLVFVLREERGVGGGEAEDFLKGSAVNHVYA